MFQILPLFFFLSLSPRQLCTTFPLSCLPHDAFLISPTTMLITILIVDVINHPQPGHHHAHHHPHRGHHPSPHLEPTSIPEDCPELSTQGDFHQHINVFLVLERLVQPGVGEMQMIKVKFHEWCFLFCAFDDGFAQ